MVLALIIVVFMAGLLVFAANEEEIMAETGLPVRAKQHLSLHVFSRPKTYVCTRPSGRLKLVG